MRLSSLQNLSAHRLLLPDTPQGSILYRYKAPGLDRLRPTKCELALSFFVQATSSIFPAELPNLQAFQSSRQPPIEWLLPCPEIHSRYWQLRLPVYPLPGDLGCIPRVRTQL